MKMIPAAMLACVTIAGISSAPAQITGSWNKVDTVTAGECNDLNPSIVHNAFFWNPGDYLWLVFERHTSTESQIAARRFNKSLSAWDSSVVVLSSGPAGEEQKYPDYSESRYYDSSASRTMRLAAWQVLKENRWQIYYATFKDGAPGWSVPSLLAADSLDNTRVRVRPILDTAFIITWIRKNTVMAMVKSLSTSTPAETLAVSSSDSLEYDVSTRYGSPGVIWTSNVQGKMTPLYRRIIQYPQIQFTTPETLQVPYQCSAPHLSVTWTSDPAFVYETRESGRWDVMYYLQYYSGSNGSLSGDSLSDNRGGRSFNVPVITKEARDNQTWIPSPLGLVVYEKARGNDSSLVFIYGSWVDTVRTPGHNWNALVGSQIYPGQAGQNVLVVWESNRSGRPHIYSRIVPLWLGAIGDRPQQGLAFELLQNYPNPFNPFTTIRYSLHARTHVTLAVFNTLGQAVATIVNRNEEAGFHDVRFDASGLASGVYFYRLVAGSYEDTKKFIIVR